MHKLTKKVASELVNRQLRAIVTWKARTGSRASMRGRLVSITGNTALVEDDSQAKHAVTVGDCVLEDVSLPKDLKRTRTTSSAIAGEPMTVVVCAKQRRFYDSESKAFVRDIDKATRYASNLAKLRAGRMTGSAKVGGAEVEACSVDHARELAAKWYPTKEEREREEVPAAAAPAVAAVVPVAKAQTNGHAIGNGHAATAIAERPVPPTPTAPSNPRAFPPHEGNAEARAAFDKRLSLDGQPSYRPPAVPPVSPSSYAVERAAPATRDESLDRNAYRIAFSTWENARRNAAVAVMRSLEAQATEEKVRAEMEIARERLK